MVVMRFTHLLVCALFVVAPVSAEGPDTPSIANDPRVVSALELARTWLEAQRAYDQIPGVSAAIVQDQQVLWSGGFGQADLASGRPAAADTIYSVCSISKLFTSIAVMQQRDAGKLRLDDPVGQHLPWFRLKHTEGEGAVTIEGLLTHASGLPRESDYPYWSAPDFAFPTHEQIVARVSQQDALYTPETHFQYSNLGLTLAGEVVAHESGMAYGDYVRRNILDPLGLASTTPEMPETQRGTRLATGYSALDRQGRRQALPFFTAKGIAPAAGYASTVGDLARFASWQFRLLANGGTEVLKATTLREMQRVHWVEPDFETTWGLGFMVWRRDSKIFVGHGGSCPGYRTSLLEMPEERVATVFMANAQGVESGQWAQRLYDIVGPAVRAAIKEPGKGKTPDAELRRYAGTYSEAPWGGEVAVLPWEDGLGMLDLPTMEPVKELVKFKKTGEHTFRRIRKDESLGEEVVFEMGPDGRPTRFKQHSNYRPRVR
jgi:CubicO group peptidase (beta-lactamase class C family)